jgi:hypothetical protein
VGTPVRVRPLRGFPVGSSASDDPRCGTPLVSWPVGWPLVPRVLVDRWLAAGSVFCGS